VICIVNINVDNVVRPVWPLCKGVAGLREEKGALFGGALKLLNSRKYPIVDRVLNVLLADEVFFRGLDGGMPQQKLYLLLHNRFGIIRDAA
jgi:hypothetical protein